MAGGKVLSTVLGALGGSLLLLAILLSVAIGSPLPVAILIGAALCGCVAGVYFLRLRRVGARQFNV